MKKLAVLISVLFIGVAVFAQGHGDNITCVEQLGDYNSNNVQFCESPCPMDLEMPLVYDNWMQYIQGFNNESYISVVGSYNQTSQVVYGNANAASIGIRGYGNDAAQEQRGNGNSGSIDIYGGIDHWYYDNHAMMVQNGNNNTGRIQQGMSNNWVYGNCAGMEQDGNRNFGEVHQRSNYNFGCVLQQGIGNWTRMFQN